MWMRSSFCESGACVEVRTSAGKGGEGGSVQVRDSKNPDGPVLTFTNDEWDAFLRGAKSGRFDFP
jgi:hypothetical protein